MEIWWVSRRHPAGAAALLWAKRSLMLKCLSNGSSL